MVAAGGSWPGNVPSHRAWEGKGLCLQVGGAPAGGPAVSCWESLWGGVPPEGSLECSLSCAWGGGFGAAPSNLLVTPTPTYTAVAGLSQTSHKDTFIHLSHLLVPTWCQALARGVPGLPG